MTTLHVKHLRRGLLAAALLFTGIPTLRAADPDAQTILRAARMAQTGQVRTLNGHLLVESTGQKIPFTLVLDGDTIRYQFKDRAVILRLGPAGSQLLESDGGDTKRVSPARYDKPVEGTDITYEDLSLNFLYWPKAKIDGSEIVDTLNCWKLHLEPPSQASAYAAMELWVSKRTGVFLKGEGYDKAGKLVKEFHAVSGQPDPQGGWMLKTMKIESYAGGGDSITKLVIDK